jgi:DhnA family fructose-bisphosphate aldolase class Ia
LNYDATVTVETVKWFYFQRSGLIETMTMHPTLQRAFANRCALKVISGLNNFDVPRVAAVVKAAHHGGATLVDIAAEPALVKLAKSLTNMPVCVSAVEPEKFVQAVAAGADLIEIGNFDSFYAQGRLFEAEEVLALTHQTRELLPKVTLSVTVPHILTLDQQVQLAEELVKAGADIIQTEGGTSSNPTHSGTLGLVEKAAPTLAAAYEISRAVSVPVLCASGISNVTAPLAIAAGAAGVGVGSAINQLNSEVAMIAAVRGLTEALSSAIYTKQSFKL